MSVLSSCLIGGLVGYRILLQIIFPQNVEVSAVGIHCSNFWELEIVSFLFPVGN